MMYASTTRNGALTQVLQLTDWSLNMNTDTQEVTSFGDVTKTYVQSLPDFSGDFKGFWNDADTVLGPASRSSDGCTVLIYPASTALSRYAQAPVWLNISYAGAVGGTVSVTGSFKAAAAATITL